MLELLIFFEQNYPFKYDCIETIADYGKIELLEWYKINMFESDKYGNDYKIRRAIEAAIKSGHLDCVKFLHERMKHKWSSHECSIAGEHGHLEVLKYLHENGCPWEKREEAGGFGFFGGISSIFSPNLVTIIAGSGHLECLKYVHENGCKLEDKMLFEVVIGKGNHEILKYLVDNGVGSLSLQFIKQHKGTKTKEDYHKCLEIFKEQIDKCFE